MKWEAGKRPIQDTSGGAVIYVAFAMFGVIGFTGLAIDVGHWHAAQRTAQEAADSAAVAGAYEAMWGGNAAAIETAAVDQAVFDGFAASAVKVNSPPTVEPNGAAPGAVEVIVEGPSVGFFGSLFVKNPIAVSTRSIAAKDDGITVCFVVVKSGGAAVRLDPDSHATTIGCTAQVDSAGSSAVHTNSDRSLADSLALSAFIADESEPNPGGTPRFNNNHSATTVPAMPTPGARRIAIFE